MTRVASVRPFDVGDADFVRRAADDAFREYSGERAGARTLRMALDPAAGVFVAEEGGLAVGFAVVSVAGERAHLAAITVIADRRGRGIGQMLLRAVERWAAAKGARSLRLETGEANVEGMSLFVGASYRRVGRLPRYYPSGYDALTFEKSLRA